MSAHSHNTGHAPAGHHGHGDHGHHEEFPHVTRKEYNTGFILSVILTAIPFGLVMTDAFEDTVSTALIIMGLGVLQIIVHMVYFLQMNRRAERSWTLPALIVTVLLVAILLVGTLWGMPPLDGNVVPDS